jgi:hypothetical protein
MRPLGSPPSRPRLIVVTVLAALCALGVNALIVALATHLKPTLRGYSHFRFVDYGALTVAGILAASVAWFAVVRVSSSPRWLFLRLAVVVTAVLWLPDVYLFSKHEPTAAIITLMIMHAAVALVTYNVLVHFAAPSATTITDRAISLSDEASAFLLSQVELEPRTTEATLRRSVFVVMLAATMTEFFIGGAELFYVPLDRPTGWLAHHGEALYVVHALFGMVLGIGALWVFAEAVTTRHLVQVDRTAAVGGLMGVAAGALGGVLSYERSLRLLAIAFMLLGVAVAMFCYLLPLIEGSMDRAKFLQPSSNPGHREPENR